MRGVREKTELGMMKSEDFLAEEEAKAGFEGVDEDVDLGFEEGQTMGE